MLSRGVGSNQHKMIDFSRRVSKPDRDMDGTGPVCGHETVSGPAGSGDLGSGRLVTEVGGCGGSHTDRIVREQRDAVLNSESSTAPDDDAKRLYFTLIDELTLPTCICSPC